jgi:hypothetical protein
VLIWTFQSQFGLGVAKKQAGMAKKTEKQDAATSELRSKLMLQ